MYVCSIYLSVHLLFLGNFVQSFCLSPSRVDPPFILIGREETDNAPRDYVTKIKQSTSQFVNLANERESE